MIHYLDNVEVVYRQVRASLVFIAQEAESFRFARVFITNQVDLDDFTVSVNEEI